MANFFEGKLQQSKEICADLDYLASILREYRDSFRDNSPLNELVYLFTSYKMIRSTLRNLDLEYLAYNRDITLADIHRRPLKDAIDGLIRLKLDLPLRES